MRGLIFTIDAILALSVIASALLIANAFSNSIHYDSLSMHVAARDYLELKSQGINLNQEEMSFIITESKDDATGSIVTSAVKRIYLPCECESNECEIQNGACLDVVGEFKTLQAWSAK